MRLTKLPPYPDNSGTRRCVFLKLHPDGVGGPSTQKERARSLRYWDIYLRFPVVSPREARPPQSSMARSRAAKGPSRLDVPMP